MADHRSGCPLQTLTLASLPSRLSFQRIWHARIASDLRPPSSSGSVVSPSQIIDRCIMSSSSGQQQFRVHADTVEGAHLRNLLWECTEEELVELCKPFAKIIKNKRNVGANRNQAIVEFADLNEAISMVLYYYASSSEPAQVCGKTVYIQYSNRQEIVNNKNSGDVAGNVLLVTIEGVEAGDVTIEVIHLHAIAYMGTSQEVYGAKVTINIWDLDPFRLIRWLRPKRH